jgi:hypothetical protein
VDPSHDSTVDEVKTLTLMGSVLNALNNQKCMNHLLDLAGRSVSTEVILLKTASLILLE